MRIKLLSVLAIIMASVNTFAQDEEYLFAEWYDGDNTFASAPGDETETSSGSTLKKETAQYAGHDLNGRFAFNENAELSKGSNGLTLASEKKNKTTMAILGLHAGDMVIVDFVIADSKHKYHIVSANAKYRNEDGTVTEFTETEKSDNNQITSGTYNLIMTEDGTLDFYNASGNSTIRVKSVRIHRPQTMPVSSTGYATFSSTSAVDISWQENFKAYYAASDSYVDGVLNMTEITDGIIPANTGVVLYGKSGEYYNITTDKEIKDNLLNPVSTDESTVKPTNTGYINYLLANKDGKIGFYKFNNKRTGLGGKAYLHLPADNPSNAKGGVAMDFGSNGTTGIIITEAEETASPREIFDLSGRKVSHPTKGLYIIDGKKVIIK